MTQLKPIPQSMHFADALLLSSGKVI
ncbi:MAG: hypothetical protein RLY82_673, partial [Pseudomonadota bacterium]